MQIFFCIQKSANWAVNQSLWLGFPNQAFCPFRVTDLVTVFSGKDEALVHRRQHRRDTRSSCYTPYFEEVCVAHPKHILIETDLLIVYVELSFNTVLLSATLGHGTICLLSVAVEMKKSYRLRRNKMGLVVIHHQLDYFILIPPVDGMAGKLALWCATIGGGVDPRPLNICGHKTGFFPMSEAKK